MGIGASIFMTAVGAIITFALDIRVGWLNLDVAGWVLMVAGVIGLIRTTVIWSGRRRAMVTREPTGYPTGYRRVEDRTDVGAARSAVTASEPAALPCAYRAYVNLQRGRRADLRPTDLRCPVTDGGGHDL